MRIGILGTGMLAEALGGRWVRAGNDIVVGGRTPGKARALAQRLDDAERGTTSGGTVHAATPREVVIGSDAVLLAVSWDGVADILRAAGAGDGAIAGTPLIDPTNAVEHGVGVLLTAPGSSGAAHIAALAPGAHVVKAFHLLPAEQWHEMDRPHTAITVALCGDDPGALQVVERLVRDAGATPAMMGPLTRARQLEEAAGFVIGLAFTGIDPQSAVPRLPADATRTPKATT